MNSIEQLDLIRVLEAIDALTGDRQQSKLWLEQPLKEFKDLTPETLVSMGRADDLIGYVRSISSGFVG